MTSGRAFGAASLNPPQWATRRPASLAGRRLSRCLLFVQGPQQGLHGPLHHPDRLFVPVPQQIRDPLHSVPGRADVALQTSCENFSNNLQKRNGA